MGVNHPGHIAYDQGGLPLAEQRGLTDLLGLGKPAHGAHRYVAVLDAQLAGRRVQVGVFDALHHPGKVHALGNEPPLVDQHLHLGLLTALHPHRAATPGRVSSRGLMRSSATRLRASPVPWPLRARVISGVWDGS